MNNLFKKVISVLLTSLIFFNMALAGSAAIGNVVEVEQLTNSDEVLEEEMMVVVTSSVVVAASVAYAVATTYVTNYVTSTMSYGGYQDELEQSEDTNYDELDFVKFDAE